MKKINYCCKNLKLGSKKVYKTIKERFPDIKQKKRDCLGNCKLCSKQCFVSVGKANIIYAATPHQLYKELAHMMG